ncbi:hypothetical protein JCM10207_006312, partial [Rhodosporidiobolus poonsookiae]
MPAPLSSPSPSSQSTTPTPRTLDAPTGSPPPSPFSASPPSLHRPPLAHLATPSSLSSSRSSPLVLDNLARATFPSSTSAALTDTTPTTWASVYRANGADGSYSPPHPHPRPRAHDDEQEGEGMRRSLSADQPSPTSSPRKGRLPPWAPVPSERRRSSIDSLQGVLDRDRPPAASAGRAGSLSSFDFLRRASAGAGARQDSAGSDLPPIEDAGGKAQVGDLSWGTKWWPFSVVEPDGGARAVAGGAAAAEAADSVPPTPPRKESDSSSSLSLLALFAGRQTVSTAHAQHEAQARQDAIEEELLGADVDALASRADEVAVLEARVAQEELEEAMRAPMVPPKREERDKALPPSPPTEPTSTSKASFLPSLFSAASTSATSASASASLSSSPPALPSLSPRLTTPSSTSTSPTASSTSLLSSLNLANPFTASSAGSLFSSLPSLPSAPRAPALAHTRTFSSSSISSERRRSTGSQADRRAEDAKENGEGGASKSEVKGMVDEADRAAVEQGVEENDDAFSVLKDRYEAPRLPVVFCHGLFGFDYLGPSLPSLKPLRFSYWIGVEEALAAMGVEVLIGRVPASASIEERATVLCGLIEERFAGREVNLVGHSMGGLDGRFLISRLPASKKTFKIRSLTTISTPHRGSSFADYLLEDVLGAERVPAFLGVMRGLGVPGGGKAFDDLTTTQMARFNEDTPDDPSVKYYSYGAEFTAGWSNPFYYPWRVISERE